MSTNMNGDQRSTINRMAVIDCIVESDVISSYMKNHNIPDEGISLDTIMNDLSGSTSDSYYQILEDYRKYNPSDFSNFVIKDFTDGGYGKYATIQTGTAEGLPTYQMCFSGTTKSEWITNAESIAQESTVQDQAAMDYMMKTADNLNIADGHLYLSGHSNGGHKVTYVTMNSYGQYADMINTSLSMDGQGSSKYAADEWSDSIYNDNKSKLYGLYGENDFVHPLGINVIPENQQFYVQYQAKNVEDGVDKLFSFHELRYMFQQDKNGQFTSDLENNGIPGDIVKNEKEYMKYFMKLDPKDTNLGAQLLLSFLQVGTSPDGQQNPAFNLTTLEQLATSLGGEESSESLKATLNAIQQEAGFDIEDLLSSKDSFKYKCVMFLLPFINFRNTYLHSPSSKKQKEISRKAATEASDYPSFQINPQCMMDAASEKNYLGGECSNIASDISALRSTLKAHTSRISLSIRTDLQPVVQRPDVDINIDLAKETKLRTQYSKEIAFNTELDLSLDKIISDLDACRDTINGLLAYLRNTGNDFLIIDDEIKRKATNMHN